MQSGRWALYFQRNPLPPFSGLKLPFPEDEELCFSKVLLPTCQNTPRYDKPESHIMRLHRCENLKSYTVYEISTFFSLLETNNA
jgi:hypothetical protein